MEKINYKAILFWMLAFWLMEAVSLLSFNVPLFAAASYLLVVSGVFVLSLYRLEYGLLAVLAELFIGSMGHLISPVWGERAWPLRLGLFVAIMAAYFLSFSWQLWRQRARAPYWLALKEFSGRRAYALLALFFALGLANAWRLGNASGLIFSDANGWLYFLILLPASAVYYSSADGRSARLTQLFLAGALWIGLKTLFLLFVFSHQVPWASEMYHWLRDSLVGEMTAASSGWPRVFIQGHVYSALAFFFLFWEAAKNYRWREMLRLGNVLTLLAAALFISSVLISLSRSFWLAFTAVIGLMLLVIWRKYSFSRALSGAAWLLAAAAVAFLLIFITVRVPYGRTPGGGFGSDFLERATSSEEPALASRWSLLPVLAGGIKERPLLGSGYGATVTYHSSDPRILAKEPTGRYTTYAFEWGYLDIWLKIGLLGMLSYLYLLVRLLLASWRQNGEARGLLGPGIFFGLIFLMVTHVFTPYLNHPLGIGFIVLSSCLIRPNRVY